MKNVSVLIVDKNLPRGVESNVAFVLGLTAGRLLPEDTFGGDVVDGDGKAHRFLTKIGHFVREATPSKLASLRQAFAAAPEVVITDYTDDAAPSSYEAYETSLRAHAGEQIIYRAIHVFGPEEVVAPLTKNLSKR
jgi:hypothetical protein